MKFTPRQLNYFYRLQRARAFSGSNSLQILKSKVIGAPLTLACWFKATNVSADHCVMSVGAPPVLGVRDTFRLMVKTTSKIELDVFTNANPADGPPSAGLIVTTKAQHACGVVLGNTIFSYANGDGVGSATTANVPASVGATGVGFEVAFGDSQFVGSIWWPFVWNIALTPTQVALLGSGMAPWFMCPENIVAGPMLDGLFDPFLQKTWTNTSSTTLTSPSKQVWTPPTMRVSVTGTTYAASTSDSAAATDLAARALAAARSASDSAAATDAASRAGSIWVRSSSDTLTVSDLASAAKVSVRSTSDSIAATDLAARTVTFRRTASDSIAATDAASGAKVSVRTASDSVAGTDAAGRAVTFSRAASDSLVLSDAASRAGSVWVRTASDSIAATDAADGSTATVRSANDSVTATDTAARSGSVWVRAAADTLSISDNAVSLRITSDTANDTVSIADAAGRLVTFRRTATDSVAATDDASASIVSGIAGKIPLPLLLRRRAC